MKAHKEQWTLYKRLYKSAGCCWMPGAQSDLCIFDGVLRCFCLGCCGSFITARLLDEKLHFLQSYLKRVMVFLRSQMDVGHYVQTDQRAARTKENIWLFLSVAPQGIPSYQPWRLHCQ